MKINYLSIIREKGEFDFEVSAMIEDLTREEYEQLKSILITSIGSMELMRRNHIEEYLKEQKDERGIE